MTNSTIVFHAYQGLSNRLRALVGYQAMAEILGKDLQVYWPNNTFCPSAFHDLFDVGAVSTLDRNHLLEHQTRGERVLDSNNWYDTIWEENLRDHLDRAEFCSLAVSYLRRLQPLRQIQERIDSFASENTLSQLAGIHIRWTDNLRAVRWWEKHDKGFQKEWMSQLTGFYKVINSLLENSERVFLATDNARIDKNMKRRYGSAVVTYHKAFRSASRWSISRRKLRLVRARQRSSSVEDALVELILLSRCRAIVGSYKSSFSILSGVWGGIPHYQVRGNECVESGFIKRLVGSSQTDETVDQIADPGVLK